MDVDKNKKTKEEMLTELEIDESKWPYYTDVAAESTYQALKKFMNFDEDSRFIYFINSILTSIELDKVDDLSELEIKRDDILKFDGEKWVTEHKTELLNCGININKHLNYLRKDRIKTYGLVVLKGLCEFHRYTVSPQLIKYTENKKQKSYRSYTLIKDTK